ncbi:MAG: tetratricopeptide repeat protein, partial [Candidatus Hydrogenedentes bacterium]|nr:tetratricopeptide repeat protein [Candidatus Hydrogenedentota bacterium]
MQRNDSCRRGTLLGVVVFVMAMLGQFQSPYAFATDLGEQLDFADSLYVRKMYDMAAHEYESYIAAADNAPETETAYFRLGESRYNLKQYDKTAAALTTLIKKFPNGDHAMQARLRLGEVLYRLGKYDDAAKYLEVVTKTGQLDTLKVAALYYLGQSRLAAGEIDKSVAAFKRLINDYPRHGLVPYARFALATAYFEAKGFKNAAEQFTSMAETATLPSSLRAEATFKAGLAHTENKEYEKGTALFDQTIREHPESPFAERAAYERAWATFYAGKIADADKLAKEFLEKHPTSKQCAGAKYLH